MRKQEQIDHISTRLHPYATVGVIDVCHGRCVACGAWNSFISFPFIEEPVYPVLKKIISTFRDFDELLSCYDPYRVLKV